jgi:recombination endonuclease VII
MGLYSGDMKYSEITLGNKDAIYNELVAQYGSRCGICYSTSGVFKLNGELKRLNIDHGHETDDIRGLLCSHCNFGIGSLGDTPAALVLALEYLARHYRGDDIYIVPDC